MLIAAALIIFLLKKIHLQMAYISQNEGCIFSIALYYVLLYTQSALQSCGGLSSTTSSVQHYWCDGCHRTTAPVRSPHSSYRWRGERDRVNQVDGIIRRPYLTRDSGGNFGQDTGVTPLLFTRSAMGFFMSTESQDLSLTSHPKDGTFYIIL